MRSDTPWDGTINRTIMYYVDLCFNYLKRIIRQEMVNLDLLKYMSDIFLYGK